MSSADQKHIPVMMDEVLGALSMQDGEVCVDGTFGAGGYSGAILEGAACTVLGIDRDLNAQKTGTALEAEKAGKFTFLRGCFGDMDQLVRNAGGEQVDAVVLDIGVSSMQIDEAERGFSFRFDGALDMRMDREGGETAADIVNGYEEDDLANLIYEYGEERSSRRIAKAIVTARKEAAIETTLQLADIVRGAVRRSHKDKIDPATRTFQALRIAVNDELGELKRGLSAAENILREGGRLVVVTFHSLEDRIVKNFMRERSGRVSSGSRYLPDLSDDAPAPTFSLPSTKAIIASDAESKVNPRARSAKMRVALRNSAPVPKGRLGKEASA